MSSSIQSWLNAPELSTLTTSEKLVLWLQYQVTVNHVETRSLIDRLKEIKPYVPELKFPDSPTATLEHISQCNGCERMLRTCLNETNAKKYIQIAWQLLDAKGDSSCDEDMIEDIEDDLEEARNNLSREEDISTCDTIAEHVSRHLPKTISAIELIAKAVCPK